MDQKNKGRESYDHEGLAPHAQLFSNSRENAVVDMAKEPGALLRSGVLSEPDSGKAPLVPSHCWVFKEILLLATPWECGK